MAQWPPLNTPLAVCCKERPNVCEPMICTETPLRPWQTIAADLFCFEGKNYLLVVDYFSRYIELALLDRGTASEDVILHCKSIFARHGIPETLITDKGPQFSAFVFRKFSDAYGFTHVTSSPRYPQSNGEAERAVQTVKALLKKTSDPYIALFMYRSTPLQSGHSPAELLMGRKLRSSLMILPTPLKPSWKALRGFRTKDKHRPIRAQQKRNFDKRHRVRDLPFLHPNTYAWIDTPTYGRQPGVVQHSHHTPRSYVVKTESSACSSLRGNRRHITPLPSQSNDQISPSTGSFDERDAGRPIP